MSDSSTIIATKSSAVELVRESFAGGGGTGAEGEQNNAETGLQTRAVHTPPPPYHFAEIPGQVEEGPSAGVWSTHSSATLSGTLRSAKGTANLCNAKNTPLKRCKSLQFNEL